MFLVRTIQAIRIKKGRSGFFKRDPVLELIRLAF
jgi:hypothetical protein